MFLPTVSAGIQPAFGVQRLLPCATGSISSGKGGRTSSSNKLNIMLVCRPIAGIWQVQCLQQGPIQGERGSQGWFVLSSAFFQQHNSPVTTVMRFCVKLWYHLPILSFLPSTQPPVSRCFIQNQSWYVQPRSHHVEKKLDRKHHGITLGVNRTFPQGCNGEKAEGVALHAHSYAWGHGQAQGLARAVYGPWLEYPAPIHSLVNNAHQTFTCLKPRPYIAIFPHTNILIFLLLVFLLCSSRWFSVINVL